MTGAFQQGDDFVAARVSIDVPTEGLQNIKELSAGLERFRTIVEASARSSATFVGYLQQMVQAANMASEAHMKLAQQLERNSDLQQRAMGGGMGMPNAASALPLSRSAPQGYVDPWAGMGAGMGGTRQPSPSDVPGYVNSAYSNNPQAYVNAQMGRHRMGPTGLMVPTTMSGAPDWGQQAQRIRDREQQIGQQGQITPDGSSTVREQLGGGTGLAHNIMNEMAVGGSIPSMINAGRHVATALGSRGQPNSSDDAKDKGLSGYFDKVPMIGPLLGKMGPAGMIAGGALAGLGLVERGGAMYQDYKNLGSIQGGGAGQGLQYEASIRAMALNPFISNDQARQVIMAGLSEGFSGKQFDSVTQFMVQNLKEMNMSVADSVKLIRQDVEGGGTPEQTQSTLGLLKEMTKGSAMSLPDMIAGFTQTRGSLISQGVSAGNANQAASEGMGVWDNDELLKGKFAQLMAGNADMGGQGGAALQMFGGEHIPGLMPDATQAYMSDHGVDDKQQMEQVLTRLVKMYVGNAPDKSNQYYNGVSMVRRQLKTITGQDLDYATTRRMVDKIRGGDFSGTKDPKQVASQQQGGESIMSGIGGAFGQIGHTLMSLGKMGADAIHGDFAGAGRAWDDDEKAFAVGSYNATADAQNPLLNSIVSQYGPENVQVVDSSGHASDLDGSRAQVQGLTSGSLKWRRKGDQNSYTLAQTPQAGGTAIREKGNTNTQVGVNFQPATVNINLDNNGRMTASPNPVQLTPNQQQVNSGFGSATMNNPPPGDGYGYYRGKMANGMS